MRDDPAPHASDPMAPSALMPDAFVPDAFAGVVVYRDGSTGPTPGLRGDHLLSPASALLGVLRSRLIAGERYLSFLWPSPSNDPSSHHIRATYVATVADDRREGVILLSPEDGSHGLTDRELEVLGAVIDGWSNRQIADLFRVAPRTVATHVEHILLKLDAPSRTEAAVHAQRAGCYVPSAGLSTAPRS